MCRFYIPKQSQSVQHKTHSKNTYSSIILLQHLHVGVLRQTSLTHGWEIGCLPARAIQVLLDLRRHLRGDDAWLSSRLGRGNNGQVSAVVVETLRFVLSWPRLGRAKMGEAARLSSRCCASY